MSLEMRKHKAGIVMGGMYGDFDTQVFSTAQIYFGEKVMDGSHIFHVRFIGNIFVQNILHE
jgi:hypothetical protein